MKCSRAAAAVLLLPLLVNAQEGARELSLTVGKSLVVDSPVNVERVSVADGRVLEAVAVTPREVVLNGLVPGQTSFLMWQQGGNRLLFDVTVRPNTTRQEGVRRQLEREMEGQNIDLQVEDNAIYLRGTVNDLVSMNRAITIASVLGKPINLMQIKVPPPETQILLKVKFADVDRAATSELGVNIIDAGALNTLGTVTTGQFSPPLVGQGGGGAGGLLDAPISLRDALNVFLFRPDLNLAVTIRALHSRRLLQILAEPNVLAINGKTASFLAGGEFPFPTLQGGGAGLGAVTVQFREFGVRINFTPIVTPRGTIRLNVTPEVSSLDFANSLVLQGFSVPGLATRRVSTELELESGQSFAIGGLLDNRMQEAMSKIPGLGDIPFLGKLFQSRQKSKNNTELLVLVTPEIVRPISADKPVPEIKFPQPFLEGTRTDAPRTPGLPETGPVPVKSPKEAIPYETYIESLKEVPSSAAPKTSPMEFFPVQVVPGRPPEPVPAPAAPPPAPGPTTPPGPATNPTPGGGGK